MARRKVSAPVVKGKNWGRERILLVQANGRSKFVWRDEYRGDK